MGLKKISLSGMIIYSGLTVFKEIDMKKTVLFYFLAIVLVLGFISCDFENDGLYSGANQDIDRIDEEHSVLHLDRRAFAAYHEGWVYTIERERAGNARFIYRMRPDGTGRQRIGNAPFSASVFHNGWLYFMDEAGAGWFGWESWVYAGSIYRMRLDGSERKKYIDTDNVVYFMLYDNWIYYLSINNDNWFDRSLYRIRIDGSGKQLIAENCVLFIISDGYIFAKYEISQFDTKIIRYNLDGTGRKILVESNTQSLSPLFTHDGFLYYMLWFQNNTIGAPQVRRMRFDGTGQEIIVERSEYAILRNVVFHGEFIYFTYGWNGGSANGWRHLISLYRVRLDGSDKKELLANKGSEHFDVIGNYIYFRRDNGISRLSINGGMPQTVHTANWDNRRFVSGWFVSGNTFFVVEEPIL